MHNSNWSPTHLHIPAVLTNTYAYYQLTPSYFISYHPWSLNKLHRYTINIPPCTHSYTLNTSTWYTLNIPPGTHPTLTHGTRGAHTQQFHLVQNQHLLSTWYLPSTFPFYFIQQNSQHGLVFPYPPPHSCLEKGKEHIWVLFGYFCTRRM